MGGGCCCFSCVGRWVCPAGWLLAVVVRRTSSVSYAEMHHRATPTQKQAGKSLLKNEYTEGCDLETGLKLGAKVHTYKHVR